MTKRFPPVCSWVTRRARRALPIALALLIGATWPALAQVTPGSGQLAVRSDGFIFWIQDGVRHVVFPATLSDEQINGYPEGAQLDAALQPLSQPGGSAPPPPPDGTSRANRLRLGQTCQCSIVRGPGERSDLQIKVVSINRNAWGAIQQTNPANTPPKFGSDYLMVTLYTKYVSGPSDLPVSLDRFDYTLIDANNTQYVPAFVFEPQPMTSQTAFPGNEMTATVTFQVPRDDTDLALVWRYNDLSPVWFGLR
jgi:hypothetical protein